MSFTPKESKVGHWEKGEEGWEFHDKFGRVWSDVEDLNPGFEVTHISPPGKPLHINYEDADGKTFGVFERDDGWYTGYLTDEQVGFFTIEGYVPFGPGTDYPNIEPKAWTSQPQEPPPPMPPPDVPGLELGSPRQIEWPDGTTRSTATDQHGRDWDWHRDAQGNEHVGYIDNSGTRHDVYQIEQGGFWYDQWTDKDGYGHEGRIDESGNVHDRWFDEATNEYREEVRVPATEAEQARTTAREEELDRYEQAMGRSSQPPPPADAEGSEAPPPAGLPEDQPAEPIAEAAPAASYDSSGIYGPWMTEYEEEAQPPGDGEAGIPGAGVPYEDFIPFFPMVKDPVTGEWRNAEPGEIPGVGGGDADHSPEEGDYAPQETSPLQFGNTGNLENAAPTPGAPGTPGPTPGTYWTESGELVWSGGVPVPPDEPNTSEPTTTGEGGIPGVGVPYEDFIPFFPMVKDPATGEWRNAEPGEIPGVETPSADVGNGGTATADAQGGSVEIAGGEDGNGGTATADASGGAVNVGDIGSGGNAGSAIGVGDTYAVAAGSALDPNLLDPAAPGPTLDPNLFDPEAPGPTLDPSLVDPSAPGPTIDPNLLDPAAPGPTLDPNLLDENAPGETVDPSTLDPAAPGPTVDPAMLDPSLAEPAAVPDPALVDPALTEPAAPVQSLDDPLVP